MNKRIKLFTSLASLCLSLAVLCFGVFAAVRVDYSLGGSVAYTVNDVFVKVETKLFWYENNTIPTDIQTPANSLKITGSEDNTNHIGLVESYADTPYYSYQNGIVNGGGQEVEHESEEIQINYGAYAGETPTTSYAYFIVIEVTNYGTEAVNAVLTNNTTGNINSKEYITEDITIQGRGENSETVGRIVIALALDDPTVEVNGVEFSYDVLIAKGELAQKPSVTIVESDTNYTVSNQKSTIENILFEYKGTSSNMGDIAMTHINLNNFSKEYNTLTVNLINENLSYEMYVLNGQLSYDELCAIAPEDIMSIIVTMGQINTEFDIILATVLDEGYGELTVVISSTTNEIVDIEATLTNKEYPLTYTPIEGDANGNYQVSAYISASGMPICTEESITILEEYEGHKVTKIADYGFYASNILKNIVIPDFITEIGQFAFALCGNAQSVTIGNQVKTINSLAFSSCSKLTNIEFKNQSILETIGVGAFSFCNILEEILIPASVTKIDDSTFISCTNLKSVEIENNSQLNIIGQACFEECENLEEITIPANVTEIQSFGFAYSGIKNITFESNSKLQKIDFECFKHCESLTQITIPANVKTINQSVFSYCKELISVNFESGSKLETFIINAFEDCIKLNSIQIPENVNRIVYFENPDAVFTTVNNNIQNLTVNENNQNFTSKDENGNELNCVLTKDRTSLIMTSSNMQLENLPQSVTNIESYSFFYSNLSQVNIPNSILTIQANAFMYSKTTSLNIPNSVTDLSTDALDCYQITQITFNWETIPEKVNSDCIGSSSNSLEVYVPQNYLSEYENKFTGYNLIGY